MKKQVDRILDYIMEFGSITQMEALADLGCMRLASRISDLRASGYNIETEMVSTKNRYGECVHYARYKMN